MTEKIKIIPADQTLTIKYTETIVHERDLAVDAMQELLARAGHKLEDFAEWDECDDEDVADFYTYDEQALAQAIGDALSVSRDVNPQGDPEFGSWGWLRLDGDVEEEELTVEFF